MILRSASVVGGTILSRGPDGSYVAEVSGTQESLNAVAGISATDVYAGGGQAMGVILHRKAGLWTAEAKDLKLGAIYGMATVGGDVFAVGDTGTIAHMSGGSWTLEMPPMGVDLHGVYGNSLAATRSCRLGSSWMRRGSNHHGSAK